MRIFFIMERAILIIMSVSKLAAWKATALELLFNKKLKPL